MFNLTVIKYVFFACLMFNLFLPIYKPFQFGFMSLWQMVNCLLLLFGFMGAFRIIFDQYVPLVPWTILRVLEICYYLFFKKVVWVLLAVGIVSDLVFILLLMMDRNRFVYKYEE